MGEEVKKKKVGRKKKTTHTSGLYRKRITIGTDSSGKKIVRAVYGKTKDEVDSKVAKLRINKGFGFVPQKGKNTFGYWAQTWKKLTKPSVEAATWMNYETVLKHISVFFDLDITKISSVDIETFITEKYEAGYSKRMLSLFLNIMSRIFRLAIKNRAALFNPTNDVSIPQKAPTKKREAISASIQAKLWELKPIPPTNKSEEVRAEKLKLIRLLALVQLKCGLRREEAVALKWEDLDMFSGTITVSRAYNFKEKCIKGPKSKAGYRSVPIPDDLLNELQSWKKACSNTLLGRIWVFQYNGATITESRFNNLWTILLDAINGITLSDRISDGILCAKKRRTKCLPPNKKGRRHKMIYNIKFTSHQLRHTYATNCIANGVDVRTVQYLMGHATAEMTMRYTHLSESALSDARKKINNADKSRMTPKDKKAPA